MPTPSSQKPLQVVTGVIATSGAIIGFLERSQAFDFLEDGVAGPIFGVSLITLLVVLLFTLKPQLQERSRHGAMFAPTVAIAVIAIVVLIVHASVERTSPDRLLLFAICLGLGYQLYSAAARNRADRTTEYLGEFPQGVGRMCALLEGARHEAMINTDVFAYGQFTASADSRTLLNAVEEAARRPDLTIRWSAAARAAAKDMVSMQLDLEARHRDNARWQQFIESPDFNGFRQRYAFLGRGRGLPSPRDPEDFLDSLFAPVEEYAELKLQEYGVDVAEHPNTSQYCFVIVDGNEAVFTFKGPTSAHRGRTELMFYTRSPALVKWLEAMATRPESLKAP